MSISSSSGTPTRSSGSSRRPAMWVWIFRRHDRPRLPLDRLGPDRRDIQTHIAGLLELPLDLVGVPELDEIDILKQRLEGDAVLRLAHQRERPVRLAVEPADRRDESGLLGIKARQLHRPFDGVGAIVNEEALLQIAGRDLAQDLREGAAQRVEQLLAGEGHILELLTHRLDDLRVPDAGAVNPETSETVDIFPPHDVFDVDPVSGPLDRGVLLRFGHRLSVLEDAGVEVG